MLFFSRIAVLPHFERGPASGGYDLYWTVTGLDFSPKYRVEWAPNPEGPWTEITNPSSPAITNNFLVGGMPIQRQAFTDQPWFRVKVFKGGTKLVLTSQPVDNRNRMDKREYLNYREMLRQVNLALTKVIGASKGFLLRQKVHGTPCPVCLDEILGATATSTCVRCYGVGIDGGYYDPVAMKAAWTSGGPAKKKNVSKEPSGPTTIETPGITLFPYPEAKSEDIWVDDGTRQRYIVVKNTPLPFCGSWVEQRLVLSLLPAHHPVYGFVIDP